ncbi:conserved hypothetical protein [Ricinus communis]|uniref:Uncharacterized protein n=1 Tax=Ricinus communis TaxID=3988 RepID=B9SD88_RICCO|nr:conserved hypothetical protein [Ricinus communis]
MDDQFWLPEDNPRRAFTEREREREREGMVWCVIGVDGETGERKKGGMENGP